MRAAILTGSEGVRVGEVPAREPGPGEVRVRVEGCGICASSLPLWEGRPWFTYPLEPGSPGHEGWGTVESTGPGVESPGPGRRVAFLSFHAFAELDVVPAAETVVLPPALDGRPFPGEPLGCAMNVFLRSGIEEGQRVAVVGVGFLGALLVGLAAGAGARVAAVSRRASALAKARELAPCETFALDGGAAAFEKVRDWAGAGGCDVAIEAAGLQSTLDLAAALVRVRGRLVIAGYHQDGDRRVDLQSWNWRGLDVVNAHERDPRVYVDGMRRAAEAMAAGRLDPSPLLTDRVPLERLAEGFRKLRERPDGFLKGVVVHE